MHFFNPVPLMKLSESPHDPDRQSVTKRPSRSAAPRKKPGAPVKTAHRHRLLVPYMPTDPRARKGAARVILTTRCRLGGGYPMGRLRSGSSSGWPLIHRESCSTIPRKRFATPRSETLVLAGLYGRQQGAALRLHQDRRIRADESDLKQLVNPQRRTRDKAGQLSLLNLVCGRSSDD